MGRIGRARTVAEAQSNGRQNQKDTYSEAWQPDPVADLGHADPGHKAAGEREPPAHEANKDQNRTNDP